MKLLVTRPALDAGPLSDLLTAAGHTVLLDPLLSIRFRDGSALDLGDVTGLLFTSSNGVRAFAALSTRRDIATYAVGDRTATLARECGFSSVESADGDVAALVALIKAGRRPEDGLLLHISGHDVAGELAQSLETAGYRIRRSVLYDAVPADDLSPATRAALDSGALDGVLLFSPRTARHFAALLQRSGLAARAGGLAAWCLSPAVVEALDGLNFRQIHIAARPTQAALLSLVPPAADETPRLKEDFVTEAQPPKATPIEPEITETPAPPASPTQSSRRRSPAIWIGLAVVILAGGAVFLAPMIKDRLEDAGPHRDIADNTPAPGIAPTPQTAAPAPPPEPPPPAHPESAAPTDAVPDSTVAARLDADEARLDRLQASAAPVDAVSGLQQGATALNQRLAALEARPAADPASVQAVAAELQRVTAGLTDAANRIARLEQQMQQQATAQRNERATVLALAELKDRLAGSGPFDGPQGVLKAALGDDPSAAPALATLDRFAAQGVASRAKLTEELAGLPAAIHQSLPLGENAGIWQRIASRAEKLVSVRRIDDAGTVDNLPPGPDHSLAVAVVALKAGDLAGAVQAVQAIDGSAGEVVKPWLVAAKDRLAVEDAAGRLGTLATQRLQASGVAQPASDKGDPQ